VFDTGYPTTSPGENYGSCWDSYGTERSVIEHNVVKNWNISIPFWLKIQNTWWSVRANCMWENNVNASFKAQQSNYTQPDDIYIDKGGYTEYCWNYSKSPENSSFAFVDKNDWPGNPQYAYRNTIISLNSSAYFAAGDLTNSWDDPPTVNNVIRVFNNAAVASKGQAGCWTVRWSASPKPAGTSRHTDASALEYLPNGVLEGTLFSTNSTGVSTVTGRLEGNWVEYRGQRGAYVE
jgi:hypothetical protein